MGSEAEKLYNYSGNNPFSDSQGRNFSDTKIQKEFYPISKFWSLFNDHHEILIGTRGSGKTFLLKMMRRSMLSQIESAEARKIVDEKTFLAFYVPLHMETVTALLDDDIPEERKIILFKFVFNSLLAESIIEELCSYLESISDIQEKYRLNNILAQKITDIWYPLGEKESIMDLVDLGVKIRSILYNFEYANDDLGKIPVSFKRELAVPLLAIQPVLHQNLDISSDSTWIICVDEAEFVPEIFQKCMNSFMRSNTNGIALKIATLPYYWKTLDTLDPNIVLSSENDFNYQILDMDCDSEDFIALTNKLCAHRIQTRLNIKLEVDTLEDFLGKVGNDNRIDYYRNIMGDEKASNEQVMEDIIASFSEKRRTGAANYTMKEKTIHQKFAPILYVREVYKHSHSKGRGRFIPEWYAGADMVRKVSQGNPRLFIRLMSSMFNKATTTHFSNKVQHQVIEKFADDFCNASLAIEVDGSVVHENLKRTGEYLFNKVHKSPLISIGCSFRYRYRSDNEFEEWKDWLQRAIAFSKLCVSDEEIIYGLSSNSEFAFSYAYAAKYWLPMRSDIPTVIPTDFQIKEDEGGQLSLFTMIKNV